VIFFERLSFARMSSGSGIAMIITSVVMLNARVMMTWLVYTEHCWDFGGTDQYAEKGRHQTAKKRISIRMKEKMQIPPIILTKRCCQRPDLLYGKKC
jgi:hypothetical protein